MVPHVGLLVLLLLHGVLRGLVIVHLPRVDAAPPDTNVVLEAGLGVGLMGAALPGAGVANVEVH